MVLCPKTRESRSPPSLSSVAFPSATFPHTPFSALSVRVLRRLALRIDCDAGWSSPVARQAHNLKVGGSNPPPATNQNSIQSKHARRGRADSRPCPRQARQRDGSLRHSFVPWFKKRAGAPVFAAGAGAGLGLSF